MTIQGDAVETINTIELRDADVFPDDAVLKPILRESFRAYKELLELFAKHGMTWEWRYYHDGKAWLCKVQKKKRTIVWMSAWKDFMQATLYFPEKHIDMIYALDINEETRERFRLTKNVGKSKPCIFEIREIEILHDFEKLMICKMACK